MDTENEKNITCNIPRRGRLVWEIAQVYGRLPMKRIMELWKCEETEVLELVTRNKNLFNIMPGLDGDIISLKNFGMLCDMLSHEPEVTAEVAFNKAVEICRPGTSMTKRELLKALEDFEDDDAEVIISSSEGGFVPDTWVGIRDGKIAIFFEGEFGM